MPGRQRDDQIAMKRRRRARRHDQAAIRSAREGRDGTLDLAGVAHVDRAHLHAKRRRHGLYDAELAYPGGCGGIPKDCHSRHAGRDLLEQLQPFRAQLYSNKRNPVALPPGRAKLSTRPEPTGSTTTGNTIGTVRVACSARPTVAAPWARMTSGASATNSAACRRISVSVGAGPAGVDPHVAADRPAQ